VRSSGIWGFRESGEESGGFNGNRGNFAVALRVAVTTASSFASTRRPRHIVLEFEPGKVVALAGRAIDRKGWRGSSHSLTTGWSGEIGSWRTT
jgi:hypothetical protein